MKRPTITTLGTIVFSAALPFGSAVEADDLEVLKSRIAVLESRVSALENSAAGATRISTTSSAIKPPAQEPKTPKSTHYVIREGDTISEIARRHKIPRSELMEINGIREGQQIFIGDRLVIPAAPAPAPPPASTPVRVSPPNYATVSQPAAETPSRPEPSTAGADAANNSFYTVKYGDTLSSISRKTGASVPVIRAANQLKSDRIVGGQRLEIPSGGSSVAAVSEKSPSAPPPATNDSSKAPERVYDNPLLKDEETYGEYVVKKGDNLYALARDFFTTMKELQRLNALGGSTLIHPGDKLIVPTSKYNNYHNKVATR